ncbi:MAG: recombinase family protein [Paenibacillaceae bacterium]
MAEKARAKRGEYTGSFAPYGYDKVDKLLVISQDESPGIVRRIFNLYQQGIGLQTIANQLTDEKVQTPAQRQNRKNASSYWHLSTIKLILQNPVYVGDMIAQRTTVAALGSNRRKRQPKEEWVFLKESHPSLVSREQFQLVNNLLSRRAFGKTKGKVNLFTNFLYCAHCGSGMYFTKRNYGNSHYVCGRYQKRGKHHYRRNPIREDKLRSMLFSELTQAHVNMDELTAELRKEAEEERRKYDKAEDILRKKIAKLEKRKGVSEDKYLDGEWNKAQYHETIERLDKELAHERSKLHQLIKERGSRESMNLKDITKLLPIDRLDRETLQALVKRIEVHDSGKVTITYNFVV